MDWSQAGLIATASADNAIRIFGEAGGGSGGGSEGAAGMDAAAAAAAADAAAAEPSLRGLFLAQQGGCDSAEAVSGSFHLLCTQRQTHPLDVNCVWWHPCDPSLLASASDDCTIKLWRWHHQSS